ncbi:MAG: DUF819 family protein, partial [Bacillota bacterium]|nr:DUF819 family protein [Bacillota bacterium]
MLSKIIKKVDLIVWAYVLGICFSLVLNSLSNGAFQTKCAGTLEIIAYGSIAIGIPLVLLSNSVSGLSHISKDIKKAFALLVISVIAVTLALHFVYTKNLKAGEILSGMALAIYTGGTPNLNAVAYTFNLDKNILFAANLSDIVIGGLFYLIIIAISKAISKKKSIGVETRVDEATASADTITPHSSKKEAALNLLISIAL